MIPPHDRTRSTLVAVGTMLLLIATVATGQEAGPAPSWTEAVAELEEATGERLTGAATLTGGLTGAPGRARLTIDALDVLYADPLLIENAGRTISTEIAARGGDVTALLHHAWTLAGNPAGGHGPPLRGAASGAAAIRLGDDLAAVEQRLGRPAAEGGVGLAFPPEMRPRWDALGDAERRLVLGLLACCADVRPLLQDFVDRSAVARAGGLPADADAARVHEFLRRPWRTRDFRTGDQIDLLEGADLRRLAYASRLLLEGVTAAVRAHGDPGAAGAGEAEPCILASELGPIGVFGRGDDVVAGDFFLVVDLGGNDRYTGRVGSTLDLARPLGVLVELGGDDVYGDGEAAGAAAAVLGVGVLWDRGGDDVYRSAGSGLAYALGGAAVLVDEAGTDLYEGAGEGTQAAATIGVALLFDGDGRDTYRCAARSQGFGGARGAGLLVDAAGDDTYDIVEAGASFVQGAGLGLWHGPADGLDLGGGVGVLVDRAGDDAYRGSSFAQGAAYFRGFGVLADLRGNDVYEATTHSQGAAAHYALAYFRDGGGDDRYNPEADVERITQSLGYGRDVSAAFFVDDAGDDEYVFGNRSAGAGDLGGAGVFWDAQGADAYTWRRNGVYRGDRSLGSTHGAAAGMSKGFRPFEPASILTLGLFLDGGGADTYRSAGDGAGAGPDLPVDGDLDLAREGPFRLRITADRDR